ncbi:MAG: Gfo/Idh/MocA family oxidoreductase, partial [Planctomycetota bacterium]|nr:Gfo/Idh/MocA family oxidoreductase [Planctomycetota bacterium]
MTDQQRPGELTRRRFAASAATAATAFTIVPRHVLGGVGHQAPSDRVNLAAIGAGGQGGGDINQMAAHGANVVALVDVDQDRAAGTFKRFPKARVYRDFRRMFDKEAKHIDGVTVGTPDHVHAVASMAAMRRGKHVYCEKPLTHTIFEARQLALAAAKHGVVTQMGNQGHATEGARLTNEWIRAGVIGEVSEVHVWTDRAGKYWKQGIGRPTDRPSIPATLDWDLWLGPVRPRPYHPAYCPKMWRGWWDFGTGAMGDMGCHIVDHPIWALELGSPDTVEAVCTLDGLEINGKPNFETYPIAAAIYYDFPARGERPAVKMTWYEGGLMPPTPAEMPAGQSLPGNGVLYVGTKGTMYQGSHGGMPPLLPGDRLDAARAVKKTMPRSPGHHLEWLQACSGRGTAVSNFSYSGPLTETVLLGV